MTSEHAYSALLRETYTDAGEVAAYYTVVLKWGQWGNRHLRMDALSARQLQWFEAYSNECKACARGMCIFLTVLFELHSLRRQKGLALAQEVMIFDNLALSAGSGQPVRDVVVLLRKWIDGEIPSDSLSPHWVAGVHAMSREASMNLRSDGGDGGGGGGRMQPSTLANAFDVSFKILCAFMGPMQSLLSRTVTVGTIVGLQKDSLEHVMKMCQQLDKCRMCVASIAMQCDKAAIRDAMVASAMSQHKSLGEASLLRFLPSDSFK
eukprot:588119-Rhodomonas_salina.1